MRFPNSRSGLSPFRTLVAVVVGISVIGVGPLGVGPFGVGPAIAGPGGIDPVTVHVFHRDAIHFSTEEPDRFATGDISVSDNGRAISRTLTVTPPSGPYEIKARVRIRPIPNEVNAVHDKWDRAGTVRLVSADAPTVELLKFVTSYGGFTEHELDVTHLAALLQGDCRFEAWIDTWLSPAWEVDFELAFRPAPADSVPEWMVRWIDDEPRTAPDWAAGVIFQETVTRADQDEGDLTATLVVPKGSGRVVLNYLASGHCTDGSGDDEFVTKNHIILVDGQEVHRLRPWRADCREFRDVNPYCRRWFNGSWSADYDRSGWCPGDAVEPIPIDLTEHLPPGEHTVAVRVEGIRPKDGEHYGYWRISAHAFGWVDSE